MNNEPRPHLIIAPRSMVVVANDTDLFFYVTTKDIEKKYGKYYSQKSGVVPIFYSLHFDDGLSTRAVEPKGDMLALNSRALIQLLTFHATQNAAREWTSDDLKLFFP